MVTSLGELLFRSTLVALICWGGYALLSRVNRRTYQLMRECSDPLHRAYASQISAVYQVRTVLQTVGMGVLTILVLFGVYLGLVTFWVWVPALIGLIVVTYAWSHVRFKEIVSS